jgi:hypothetical protein
MNLFPYLGLSAVVLLYGCAPFLGGQTRNPSYDGNGPGAISLPPLVAYQSSSGPLSYRAAVAEPGGLRAVHGEACQSAITLPVGLVWAAFTSGNTALAAGFLSGGWGSGGYVEAVADALSDAPGARLVDVRADLQTKIILGIWRQQCVRITALAVPPR